MMPENIFRVARALTQTTQISNTVQKTASSGIDWNEIVYVLVGALIGFLGSVIVLLAERALDKKGTIQIFYRRTNQPGMNRRWGFERSGNGKVYFTVPVVFEIQNTSNTTRVIRDVSLLLYSGTKFIGKMYQSPGIHITKRKNGEITEEKDYKFGAEKGSYSFVLPPRSIQRQECEYAFSIESSEKTEKQFDTVVVRYYDEKNTPLFFKAMTIENAWVEKDYEADKEWFILNEKVKFPKT